MAAPAPEADAPRLSSLPTVAAYGSAAWWLFCGSGQRQLLKSPRVVHPGGALPSLPCDACRAFVSSVPPRLLSRCGPCGCHAPSGPPRHPARLMSDLTRVALSRLPRGGRFLLCPWVDLPPQPPRAYGGILLRSIVLGGPILPRPQPPPTNHKLGRVGRRQPHSAGDCPFHPGRFRFSGCVAQFSPERRPLPRRCAGGGSPTLFDLRVTDVPWIIGTPTVSWLELNAPGDAIWRCGGLFVRSTPCSDRSFVIC